MKRTTEFVLGLIGGILGILCALIALFIGGLNSALDSDGANTITALGWGAVILSILGICGSILVKTKAKMGGTMLVISAVGGLICISFFYILPAILLLISGLMGIFRKEKAIVSE
ncbi:DUF4064 domain-containing protein [Bacillus paramycoides]|uniref:DUF4064 domain-containing protein n=1 Tax=Bacillus paramycoides TaxID=2026194 RepID=UPI002242DC11|nr:DUF4064 domain-containing protein [Bacillus paramycoides]MCW9134285.1 DUF4064 domain-containing protein [Bacillus paramycoides]